MENADIPVRLQHPPTVLDVVINLSLCPTDRTVSIVHLFVAYNLQCNVIILILCVVHHS